MQESGQIFIRKNHFNVLKRKTKPNANLDGKRIRNNVLVIKALHVNFLEKKRNLKAKYPI